MRPLSYLLLVTLALATGGQAVVHGNRNGYRYNGPSHKYLPAEGAPSTDAVTTTGHWQPQVHEEQREREPDYLGNRQEHWQPQQSGHKESSSLGQQQQHQQGYRQEQQGHFQHAHPLQEVEYLIHQQRPQGFSQYQGNRQSESSYGQQQLQHENHKQQHSENHWDSSSHQHQQQGPHKQQQLPQQTESHWDSSAYQQQQQGPHKQQQQAENPWEHQQHGSRQQQQQQLQSYWESSFGQQHQHQQGSHQQQKENNWESSYGQHGSQQQPENHWSGPLSSNNIHGSQGSDRWQPSSSHASYPLQSLDLLPVAHAHANSQKTLARPTNHVNQIPGYTLSSNPEHERFIGLDAADNRLLTQSLPFQSPSAPFRPGNNHHEQQHGQSSTGHGHSHNFLQMQSQSYELPPTQHTQHGWVASQSAHSHANEPNRQFQPPYY
ncbi:probable basic-leucine zipper transcription factor Q [Drosophila tropicalis]|uniref:probable basic-leucine zipper transcription factor Q n=1 Tax=Drosophila tropicalis TaxID=46794 RepID=UPI0035ABA1BC